MGTRSILSALRLAAIACSSSAIACSTTDASSGPAGGGGAEGPGAGASDGDAAAPVPIVAEPEEACPPPYDAKGRGPVAGDNTGFLVAGQSRSFHLLLPPATFGGPRPVLFAFHGTTETGPKFVARARLGELAERGFIVVAPNAVGNGSFWPVWDAMRAPGAEGAPNADVALFDELLSCTAAHYAIDQKRVFAAGHSAGGIFTNRLLRARSNVLAGGVVGSGVFDLTSPETKAPLEPMLVVVTWGGDNDTYRGTTPNGVSVPAFSFVEQASLASKYYAAEQAVAHARCRGAELGHAWLPLNAWFADLLLSHPKGTPASSLAMPALPAGARATCSVDPYELAPLAQMTCPSTTRAGCAEACQLFADCAVENRTVGPSLAAELSKIGFTQSSCAGCVQRCQSGATTPSDAQALACFSSRQQASTCGAGIEGAAPLFEAVNQCCAGKTASALCVDLCTTLQQNSAAKAFFPECAKLVP